MTAPEVMPQAILRQLRRHSPETAVRAILRWPDRVCFRSPKCTFMHLWEGCRDRESDDPLEETVIRFAEALCAYRCGLSAQAEAGFRRVLEATVGRGTREPWWVLSCAAQWSLALALRRMGELEQGVRLARAAASTAKEHEAFWLEGAARLALGRLLCGTPGQASRARGCFDEAHRLLSVSQPPDPLGLAYVRAHEARLMLDEGQAYRALSLIREARSGFGRSHHYRALAHSRVYQGWAHVQLGATRAAGQCGQEALEQLRVLGNERGVLRAQKLLARVALEEGRAGEAERCFEQVAQGAESLADEALRAEAYVGVARSRLAQGGLRGVWQALNAAGPVLRASPTSTLALEGQAIEVARQARRRRSGDVRRGLRALRAGLRRWRRPRLTAECMALCGFELARQGRLRDAAPVLKAALAAASQPDAVAWTEHFLSTVKRVDVQQWITSLVTEIRERSALAREYNALAICAYAGLHDTKNLASSAYYQLETLASDCPPSAAESEEERALFIEINQFKRTVTRDFPKVTAALASAKGKAFEAGRLAEEVSQQVRDGDTAIRLAPKPLDVGRLLADQKGNVEGSTELGRCIVEADEGLPKVMGDERYLTRVFSNLISNAEKYARGSDITLSAHLRPNRKRPEVVIGFADSGPGIHPEDAEIIFEPFTDPSEYREKRANHGSGFGLYYCKRVIEAHGGRIWLRSRPQIEGATFYFTLPVAA